MWNCHTGGWEEINFISALYFPTSAPSPLLFSHYCISPDVHDQPFAIFSVVHRLHIHHSGLNSRLILGEEKSTFVNKGKPMHEAVVTTPFASMVSMIPAGEKTNTCWIQSSEILIRKKLQVGAKSRTPGIGRVLRILLQHRLLSSIPHAPTQKPRI